MKYVRFSEIGFVLFPEFIHPSKPVVTHAEIAHAVRRQCNVEVLSAGFCTVTGVHENGSIEAFCFGHSESLAMGGLKDDSEKLTEQLGITREPR